MMVPPDSTPPGPTQHDSTQPDFGAAQQLARQLGVSARATDDASAVDGVEEATEGGTLRLDKDGTLAGRPKLAPVRALRDEGTPASATPSVPAGSEQSAPGPGPRKAVLPPKRAALRPLGFVPTEGTPPPTAPGVDDDALLDTGDEVEIPEGDFLFGDEPSPRYVPPFHIDRFPVTNRDYAVFVEDTHHRAPMYWQDGSFPEALADHPVVGVDYFDALAYAQWAGKDLPFEDEWERAARGTDGRTFPWGDETEFHAANTARTGLKMTTPVALYRRNESPHGCRDMVGNAWELTHSPASGGGVVVRGGSWYDFALYAKTYFRFATAPTARNGTIGFRCVRRHKVRPDEPREVDEVIVEAEVASRRGAQPPVALGEFSPERRDLVMDLPRLEAFVYEVMSEALTGTIPASARPAPDEHDAQGEDLVSVPEPAVAFGATAPPAEPAPAPAEEPEPAPHSPSEGPRIGFHRPAAGVAPAAGGRVHVTDIPAGRDAPSAPTFDRAVEDAAQAQRLSKGRSESKQDAPQPKSMPWIMWVLLAAGFALFGAVLVSLLASDRTNERPKDADDTPADAAGAEPTDGSAHPIDVPRDGPAADLPPAKKTIWDDLPAFPAYGEGTHDGQPLRIIDAATDDGRTEFDRGTWILFFLDPDEAAGLNSLPAIHRLHRRTADSDLSLAVVLDRARLEQDGELLAPGALAEVLRGFKFLADGMTVVLDPRTDRGTGLLQSRFARPGKSLYASLIHQGVTESRTRPPRSANGFQMRHLEPLVERAVQLVPGLRR